MLTRAQAKLIRKLKSRKRRDAALTFLAEGVRLVEELETSDFEIEFVVTAPALGATPRGRRLLEALEARGCEIAETPESELKKLSDTETPQGVLAVARHPGRALADQALESEAAVLVFDRVADPGNLGTLVRTGQALGLTCAVALPGSADPWSPKATRASAGSLFHLPVYESSWPELLAWLRSKDFAILCADSSGEPVRHGLGRPGRFALVMGNEPFGISREVREDCDRRVAVELPGGMDSLNVAVAGALLLDRLLAPPPSAD
jgi:TrmH family RNA methyltransferase